MSAEENKILKVETKLQKLGLVLPEPLKPHRG